MFGIINSMVVIIDSLYAESPDGYNILGISVGGFLFSRIWFVIYESNYDPD